LHLGERDMLVKILYHDCVHRDVRIYELHVVRVLFVPPAMTFLPVVIHQAKSQRSEGTHHQDKHG
jgi:hypothetical protein